MMVMMLDNDVGHNDDGGNDDDNGNNDDGGNDNDGDHGDDDGITVDGVGHNDDKNLAQQISNILKSNFLYTHTIPQCIALMFIYHFTRLILPLMQSYSYAGDFTVRGKIKTALLENAIWYGSYIAIFLVLLIYVIARPDLELNG